MTVLPYTTVMLQRRGFSADRLERAARHAFTHAETAPVRTVQQLWGAFVEAHALLYRGGQDMREVA